MRKFFLATAFLAAAFCAPGIAHAQTTMSVGWSDESRSPVEYLLTTDSKLIFGSNLTTLTLLSEGSETDSFPLSEISKITFDYNPLGVNTIVDNRSPLRLRENPITNCISLIGEVPGAASLQVFSISGALEIFIPEWKGEDIDASQLPKGLHILKINSTSLKLIKL